MWELSELQRGVVGHDQLLGLGFSEKAIEHRLGDRLHPVHRGVYAVGRRELSDRGRWMAAILACGDGAALSHESGAALLKLLDEDPGRPHVSVPGARHPKHPGIRVHRRFSMPGVIRVDGIPVLEPLAVLVDLAPARSLSALETLVNQADKLGLIHVESQLGAVAALNGRPGIRKLHAVLSRHSVTDSGLERRFLHICATAGIPRPLTQRSLHGFRVDFHWPELGLVVETDGLTYHRTPAQQAKDRLRDQTLTAAGLTCLRFTNWQVRRDERAVAATMSAVIARLRNH